MRIRYDVLKEFADLAAEGRFSIPIAHTFALGEWKTALPVSEGKQARGKLMLLP
jgi:NADPH:quinone reductase-like Zn-dependent oxidoreductase